MLALSPGSSDVSAFDLFVQFILPEILIPVVRRLFAPSLGCVFFYPEEYTPCGHTACLGRELTMACSTANIEYVILLVCGTIVLIPVWGGIIVAMVTYQSDMSAERPPRWPVMSKFVLLHAQLKVLVAMATDSLRDHPGWMLGILLFSAAADFVLVAGMQPHQHRTLNRYRMHGAAFSMWACLCAFVALAIDDKTSTSSMLLFVMGYWAIVCIIAHKRSSLMTQQYCFEAVGYLSRLFGPCLQTVLSLSWVKSLSDLEESVVSRVVDDQKRLLAPGAAVEVFVSRQQDWVVGRIEAINGQQAEVSYPDIKNPVAGAMIDSSSGTATPRRRGMMVDMNDPSMFRRVKQERDNDVVALLTSRPASPDVELKLVGSETVCPQPNSQFQPEPKTSDGSLAPVRVDAEGSSMLRQAEKESDDDVGLLLKS